MRHARTVLIGAGLALLAQTLDPTRASAHGIGGVGALPIPTWLFAWAGSIVLVLSFVALATLWPEPRFDLARERVIAVVPKLLEPIAGAIGVACFALIVYAGLLVSRTVAAQNLAPVAVFVFFWVALAVASFLFGDLFRALNPWRATARATAWLARRVGLSRTPPLRYPARLGQWPAAAGILVFVWVELVYPSRDVPSSLAVLVLACGGTQLLGMAAFGIEAWERYGDPFAVYFGLFAKLSPLRLARGHRLAAQPAPRGRQVGGASGNDRLASGHDREHLVRRTLPDRRLDRAAARLAGESQRPRRPGGARTGRHARAALHDPARSGHLPTRVRGIGERRPAPRRQDLSRRFAHTLVPIALAYITAHYFTFLVYQGQSIGYLISDPLGNGANLFGTAHATDRLRLHQRQPCLVRRGGGAARRPRGWPGAGPRPGRRPLPARLGLGRRPRRSGWACCARPPSYDAIRSQYWMLGVMVAFTGLGLWLLSEAA